ncbi:MAG TPA: Cna B-type domain-containing protein [Firmicutes bacterium]|nr:Cna B-type domain-containing protein [Bacillota bacterium]
MKGNDGKRKTAAYVREHALRRRWRKLTAALAALTAAAAAVLLILPAVTMEGDSVDFAPHVTEITIEKNVGGAWTPAEELVSGDSVRVTIYYVIPEGIVGEDSRTIHYQLPSGIGLGQAEEGPVKIDSDTTAGTYAIDTDGRVTILFDEEFADGRPFTGNLSFQGTVTATGETGDDVIDLGAAGGTVTVAPKEEESDLAIAKSGWYEESVQGIGYSVTVSSAKGTDGPVQVADAFLTGGIVYDMAFPDYPLKIVHSSGREITDCHIAVDNTAQPASFTITGLPALAAGESYTITYAAFPDLSSAEASGYLQFTNRAVARDETNEAQAQANTVVSRAMIYKEGSYNALTRKITWTIFLNEDRRDIRGYTLTDAVACRDADGKTYTVAMPDTVTITPYAGSAPAGEGRRVSLPYTFPEDLAAPYDTCNYLVTYETELPEDAPAGTALTFSNKALFGEYEAEAEAGVTMPGKLDYDVEKAFISAQDHNRLINWASLITYPQDTAAVPDSLTYIDWVMDILKEDETFLPGTHYTTASLLAGAVLTSADESIRLVSGQDYAIYAAPSSVMESFDDLEAAYGYLYTDFSEIDGYVTWYPLEQIGAWGLSEEPLALIKVVFTQSALDKLNGQPILLRYQTQVDTEKLPLDVLLTLPNLARIPGDSSIAAPQHTFTQKLDKQASPTGAAEGSHDAGSYTNDPLHLNSGEISNLLHYRILISDYGEYSGVGQITVTDTLPAGAELVEDSVVLRLHPEGDDSFTDSTTSDWYLREVSARENADGTTTVAFIIGHINELSNVPFGIYYDVSIANDPALADGGTATYVNTAGWDGETDSTTTTVKHTLPVLEKTGVQLTDGTGAATGVVRYFVTVNPQGQDLDENNDTLTLTDTLTIPAASAAAFRPDSVKLYRYDPGGENHCGELMPAGSFMVRYDDDTRTITFILPDSTPCVVVYEYTIDQGNTVGDIPVSNMATLSGKAGSSTETGILIEEQTSQAGVNKATLTIYKHDAANAELLLPGARFRLERYERQGDGSYVWKTTALTAQGPDGTFVVGGSGAIELSFVDHAQDGSLYNALYRLTEVEAPAGYEAAAAPYYFVWMRQGADEEETREAMQAVWTAAGVEPEAVKFIAYSTNDSLYIPNAPTALTVEKVWRDENGETLPNPPESVAVTLYQVGRDGGRTVYERVELNAENNWSYTWNGLPKADGSGGEYRYTVEEESIPGFVTAYSINNAAGIQTGVLIITNTRAEEYILPETGGIGLFPYMTAGLLLIGAFCAGTLSLRRGRRKEGKHTRP